MTDFLLKEEKHTNNAISFEVTLDHSKQAEEPEIKKRLENSHESSPITMEQIQEKLQKAEERRRMQLKSENLTRRNRTTERKASLDQSQAQKL